MSDDNMQQQSGDDPSGLRKALEETRAELKALKAERRQRAYTDAGIPEGAHDIFDSMYSGELEVDRLREFAQSKGIQVLGSEQSQDAPPAQPAAAEGQSRLDAVDQAKLPSEAPTLESQILEAVSAGDFDTSFKLKSQLLDQQRSRKTA